MDEDRNRFWDAVKGMSIIAVLLIHTTTVNSVGGVVWRQFINWPVALFFFMSGYFCTATTSYGAFVLKKAKRLLVPLFVCSLVYALIGVMNVAHQGSDVSILFLWRAFISFPLGWGYFILALFQCFLIAPLLARIPLKRAFIFSILLYLPTALYSYLAATCYVREFPFRCMFPEVLCIAWLPFFILGQYLRSHRLSWVDWPILWVLALAICCVTEILSGLYWVRTATFQLARSQIRLANVAFALILACGLPNLSDRMRLTNGNIERILVQLGEVSLVVYLWHRLVIILLRRFLPTCLIQIPWMPLIVVLVSICVAYAVPRRVRKGLWWLGF